MDSLKVPKGGGSSGTKSPGSIPMAIRFNAGEESVEDVLKPSESLSSSPQQSSEDFSWRKDFLQGSFFHRKRSGSIEGGSSPGSSLISNLSSSEANTVGTWKLIKGKVSQAMEDIKSSKSVPTQPTTMKSDTNNDDSDIETATINSSISDEFSMDPAPKISGNQTDSDLDIDPSILLTGDDIESSTIHKPLATLRSNKTIPKSTTTATIATKNIATSKKLKKDDSPSRSTTPTSIRSTFLRKRKKQNPTDTPSIISIKPKKDIEIESGIEMLEDMVLPTTLNNIDNDNIDDINDDCFKDALSNDTIDDMDLTIMPNNDIQVIAAIPLNTGSSSTYNFIDIIKIFITNIYKSRTILISATLLITLIILPVPEFFRGVIACLFTISLFSCIIEIIKLCIERINHKNRGPEKSRFEIPDYSLLPICEIPAAEEHKPLKSYSGWMNEINNYDPTNYHISMTIPVYVRLDGSILRVSNTTTRIPKRSMWNEQLIDKKNIIFTRNRCFNLSDCRVEMCPRGLARKRHFSRKYPIQLIVKNSENIRIDDEHSVKYKRYSTPTDQIETTSIHSNVSGCDHHHNQAIQNDDGLGITHQSSNESNEDRSEKAYLNDLQNDMDFAATILNSDLQKLQDTHDIVGKENVPCGDETRILLFARCDREKEDWYRRFCAASIGAINDQELHIPDIVMITEDEIKAASEHIEQQETSPVDDKIPNNEEDTKPTEDTTTFEGLLMTTDAARNPAEYIRFMSKYQNRRKKKQEDELWKGIDQSLYLGPSGSVIWANVLIGRILFSCLNDAILLEKIQKFLQKKLSAIRLPSFMEDVVIAQVYLGDTPPLIHRVSQPLLDERGTWIDADLTYEGLMHMTITTKLNLLRLKRQQQSASTLSSSNTNLPGDSTSLINETSTTDTTNANCAIYDSNAESSGGSSSESECPTLGTIDPSTEPQQQISYTAPGNSRRILRIVDRITASNLFQSATEISYIQRAMENMSTTITLRVELKGLVSRIVINLPPPPSDRIWIAFRGPPRLWISAKPAVGDHTFDWSIVTNVIESKLCEEVYKYLVYPNMVDIIAPFLGQSTYKE